MALKTVGIVHACPGDGCAICRYVARRFWLYTYAAMGGESIYESEAKTLDAGTEIAENEATRNSVERLNRA